MGCDLGRTRDAIGSIELGALQVAFQLSLKAQIADAQQAEVDLEEQAARRRQMWDSIMECAAGYTEFDNELVRQVIQKITVEDAETIHIHFRDSDVVLEQEVE